MWPAFVGHHTRSISRTYLSELCSTSWIKFTHWCFLCSTPPMTAPAVSTDGAQRTPTPGQTASAAHIQDAFQRSTQALAQPETPLAAVRTVNTDFTFVPPVASSLPSSQQRQLAIARHHAPHTSSFACSQSNGPSTGPSTAKPSSRNGTKMIPAQIKCAIIPFAVSHDFLMANTIHLLTNS
jgi:hypothetical protein